MQCSRGLSYINRIGMIYTSTDAALYRVRARTYCPTILGIYCTTVPGTYHTRRYQVYRVTSASMKLRPIRLGLCFAISPDDRPRSRGFETRERKEPSGQSTTRPNWTIQYNPAKVDQPSIHRVSHGATALIVSVCFHICAARYGTVQVHHPTIPRFGPAAFRHAWSADHPYIFPVSIPLLYQHPSE